MTPWRLPSSEGGPNLTSYSGHASLATLPAPYSSAGLNVSAEPSFLRSIYACCNTISQKSDTAG